MKNLAFLYFRFLFFALIFLALISSCQETDDKEKWLRSNLHTYTFWSDGDDFPESVAKWYKENSYDFLVFTDHDILLETPTKGPVRRSHVLDDGELWQRLSKDHQAVVKYTEYFGEEWVDVRQDEDDNVLVRLKPLDVFRHTFKEPGEFMLYDGKRDHRSAGCSCSSNSPG